MTASKRLLLIRGISPLRAETSEAEILDSLSEEDRALSRTLFELDTRPHEEGVASGYWPPVNADVRGLVTDIRVDLERNGPATVRYFGLEECPTLIALGAYLGDEHLLETIDYDRDSGGFAWPEAAEGLRLETIGLPREAIETAGDVTLRIELTYPVQDEDVEDVVDPAGRLADITIRPADGVAPKPKLIRSQHDVEHLREAVRDALAVIEQMRSGTQVIHLFLAGPVSACLAVGRELRLRNGRRTQTYRFRAGERPRLTRALLLTPEAGADSLAPLDANELATVQAALALWRAALAEVREHAEALRATGAAGWPGCLIEPLRDATPDSLALPGIWTFTGNDHELESTENADFRFDRRNRVWHMPERMLLAMHQAAAGDESRIRKLARAFYWHEYLHDFQALTEHTAPGVGAFPNCLERVDYMADVYGVLHQADFLLRGNQATSDREIIGVLVDCITEAIDSFWTFEPRAPWAFWQQRRLRRYLNWYWRREQIANSGTLDEAMTLLCEPPVIELAGPSISTDSRRVFLDLTRIRQPERLEVAFVDEAGRLRRFPAAANLSIGGLLEAFRTQDRAEIDSFFAALFEHARR